MSEGLPVCPKCGYSQPWSIEVRGVYDGALVWECPNCKHRWPRFTEGRLRRLGVEWIEKTS